MRCNRVDSLLSGYLEGDLSHPLNRQVSDHLDACDRCRAALAAQQRVLRALDTGRQPISIDLWADFSRRLQQEPIRRRLPWGSLWQPGMAVALAAVVVALVARSAPPAPPTALLSPAPPVVVQLARTPEMEASPRRGSPEEPGPSSSDRPPARQTSRLQSSSSHHRTVRFPTETRPRPVTQDDTGPATNDAPRSAAAPRRRRARSEPFGSTDRLAPRWHVASPRTPVPTVVATVGLDSDPVVSHPLTGDPLKVAEALVNAQQDSASRQMRGELMRLAREVARVGGEPSAPVTAADGGGT